MKKVSISVSYLLFLMSILFFSCKEESSPAPGSGTKTDTSTTSTSTEYITATVNGSAWVGADAGAYALTILDYTVITISADNSSSDVEGITISLEGTTTPGTYTLSVISTAPTLNVALKGDEALSFVSGQIVVTKNDSSSKLVEGTFTYTGKDASDKNYSITEGSFSATY